MDIDEIFEYLPHRYPFLLVDRVTEIHPGKDIRGYKNVSVGEPFFQGHFPDHPIMPGVLLIEAMAQLAGILAFKTRDNSPAEGYLHYLEGTDKTRFKRQVVPGDRLLLEATILTHRRTMMKFNCNAYVDDELACTTELLCAERKI